MCYHSIKHLCRVWVFVRVKGLFVWVEEKQKEVKSGCDPSSSSSSVKIKPMQLGRAVTAATITDSCSIYSVPSMYKLRYADFDAYLIKHKNLTLTAN